MTPSFQPASTDLSTTQLYLIVMGAVIVVLGVVLFLRVVKAVESIIRIDQNVQKIADKIAAEEQRSKD